MSILDKKDKSGNAIFFDLLHAAVVKEDPIAMAQVKIGIQAFMNEPVKRYTNIMQALNTKKAVQGFTVSTDLPFLTGESFTTVNQQNAFDLGFEQVFQNIPRIQGKRYWSALSLTNGLTIKKIPEGGRVDVVGVSGSKLFFYCDKYGGAIGWTYEAIEGREIIQLMNIATIFRNKYYENKSNVHYALIEAAGEVDSTGAVKAPTPYDTGTDGQLRRDIRTINLAIYTLTNRLKDKGYGDMANAGVVIYANRSLEERINAALRASTEGMQASANGAVAITSRPKNIIYTYNSSIAASTPVVCLPGWGFQKMDYMTPTVYTDKQDILTLNMAQAVWGDYGAGVADVDQAQRFILG